MYIGPVPTPRRSNDTTPRQSNDTYNINIHFLLAFKVIPFVRHLCLILLMSSWFPPKMRRSSTSSASGSTWLTSAETLFSEQVAWGISRPYCGKGVFSEEPKRELATLCMTCTLSAEVVPDLPGYWCDRYIVRSLSLFQLGEGAWVRTVR